ncbi:hypothetical protein [Metabacillus fastidiosus]|uniref:hypothetical protein n=1 Tax=Metabacillus fastidiosus TaxID=1458 RepID=UPI003D277B33
MEVLREYVENGKQFTEYTKDYTINEHGKIVIDENAKVSHTISVDEHAQIPEGETLPVQPTFSQRIAELEAALVETTTVAAQQEQRSTQNEQAIVELTMLVGGQA